VKNRALTFAANISIMFGDTSLAERPSRAKAAGFDFVEAWWPFPSAVPTAHEVDGFVASLTAAGVRLSGLNFYAGDMPAGERGVACRPERRAEFDASLPVLHAIAERTGCRQFNCLFGQYEPGVAEEAQRAAAVDALAAAAASVADIGGTILIEPLARGLNGNYPLQTDADVITLIDDDLAALGVSNATLLFDVFHLGSNGVDIVEAARRLGSRVGHVQLADAPGRHEPGSGDLPIASALDELVLAGYAGYVGCEYKPAKLTEDGLEWMTRMSSAMDD
jgi:hydroxypyruvate isomerase